MGGFDVGGAVGGAVSGYKDTVNPQKWANDPVGSYKNYIKNGMGGSIVDALRGGGVNMPGGINSIFGGGGGEDKPAPFYMDPGAKPNDPSMRNYINGNGELDYRMKLAPELQTFDKGNTGALDAINSRALSSGPSPWMNMQLQKQGQEEHNAMNGAVQQAQSGTAGNLSNLAMRGGLSSGAMERASRFGAQDLNAARQGVQNQGAMARTNIGIADDAQKTALLGQAAGLNVDYRNAANASNAANTGIRNQTNLINQQSLADQARQETGFGMDKYKQQMSSWGAANTANAIASAGGGSK